MMYKKIYLPLLILISMISFQDAYSQNQIGIELIFKPATRSYSFTRISLSSYYTPRLGILGNYSLDKKAKHRIETGLYTGKLSFEGNDYFYVPSLENTTFTNFKSTSYYIIIPIRYSYNMKGFYVEGGVNGSFIAASRIWVAEKELFSKEKHYSPFVLEYHLGLGYKYSYKKFDFRLGLSSDIYKEFTYHDTGIDFGINYKLN